MAGGGIPSKQPELDLRRGLHVKLFPDTHAAFRMMLFKKGLSMQEIIEEFAARCVDEEKWCLTMINDVSERKRERIVRRLSNLDGESLLDEIERDSPYEAMMREREARKKG